MVMSKLHLRKSLSVLNKRNGNVLSVLNGISDHKKLARCLNLIIPGALAKVLEAMVDDVVNQQAVVASVPVSSSGLILSAPVANPGS